MTGRAVGLSGSSNSRTLECRYSSAILPEMADRSFTDSLEVTNGRGTPQPCERQLEDARGPVGCKLRIPTPRNTKIALTGSGCQEVSKRASSVIRWERAGNGFDVTRRGIAGIAPNSKRPDSPGRFAQAAIEYSRRTPPSRSIRRILTEPSSGPSGTRGTGTSRSIPRCGLAEL